MTMTYCPGWISYKLEQLQHSCWQLHDVNQVYQSEAEQQL